MVPSLDNSLFSTDNFVNIYHCNHGISALVSLFFIKPTQELETVLFGALMPLLYVWKQVIM